MKTLMKIVGFLSWFNLIVGAVLILGALLSGIGSGNIVYLLTSIVLVSAIVLHSYAALQLRKSIMHPEIPLGNQTPTGIRFIGFVALFFAFMNIVNSVTILQHTADYAQQIKLPQGAPPVNLQKVLQVAGIFSLIFSACILSNVILNFNLLRWYRANQKPG